LLLVVSHATAHSRGPVFSYEFENATVEFSNDPGASITARFTDGTVKNYGSPNEARYRKLWLTMKAVREGQPPLCGIEAASSHTLCTWTAQQSTDITTFPASLIRVDETDGARRNWVEGLGEKLQRCYESFMLPSELDFDWAEPGREILIDDDLVRGRVAQQISSKVQ